MIGEAASRGKKKNFKKKRKRYYRFGYRQSRENFGRSRRQPCFLDLKGLNQRSKEFYFLRLGFDEVKLQLKKI